MNHDNRERLIAEASKVRDITKLDIDEGLK